MMENISADSVKELLEFIKSHPSIRDDLVALVSPGQFVKRDELTDLLEEIKQLRIDSNKRFEAMQEQIDNRFDKVFDRFDELTIALGHDFEEFNSLWLQDFLRNQGYPKMSIKKKTFVDENFEVFPDSTDVELDIYCENPFVIGEVTAIVKNISKVTLFLRKVEFLKKLKKKEPQLFFVTYGFRPEFRDKALELLNDANVKVYTLRQRDL
jgi:hypothetical protein